MTYLGVPILATRLTKVQCASLVDKIIVRAHLWATRNIFYAGRARLINSVIFGMYTYWHISFYYPEQSQKISTGYAETSYGVVQIFIGKLPIFPGTNHVYQNHKGGLGIKDFTA